MFLPVVAGVDDPQVSPSHLTDTFLGDLFVVYTAGPPFGQRLLTRQDLDGSGMPRRELRREAAANLYGALERVGIHGQPPALMLSFDGLESSVLLAHRFWDDVERSIPGELVVGVPARDVVIFTGMRSRSGLQKVQRAVDRVFFAGGPHPLSRDLLVRRRRRWEVLPPHELPPEPSSEPLPGQFPLSAPPHPASALPGPGPGPQWSAPRSPVSGPPVPEPSLPRQRRSPLRAPAR
jgi:hypothetical protein